MEKSPIILSQNHDDQVREIVYTANGEKITNEDSPLRNSDLVQLVGFTTYSNTLGDDGYELIHSLENANCPKGLCFIQILILIPWSLRLEDDLYGIHTSS